MFSPLVRGYGSWTGEINIEKESELSNLQLPNIKEETDERHRHGITVSPRVYRSTTNYSLASHKDDGQVDLPKTYTTKKGALLLFSAPPDDLEKTNETIKLLRRKKAENLLDRSLKLNTLERLYLSALQYGDLSNYNRDKCSVSDPENSWFLKFLHGIDSKDIDLSTKPGADIDSYLRDLKTRASERLHGSNSGVSRKQRSRELRSLLHELDGVWRSKSQTSLKPEATTLSQRSSFKPRILSSKSLTASIKSSTYLGRADSSATNFSTDKSPISSPVALPEITTRHARRRKASWISPVANTEESHDIPKDKSIGRMSRSKTLPCSKTGNDGRRSADSKTSRLSDSANDVDEGRSSSSASSRPLLGVGDVSITIVSDANQSEYDAEVIMALREEEEAEDYLAGAFGGEDSTQNDIVTDDANLDEKLSDLNHLQDIVEANVEEDENAAIIQNNKAKPDEQGKLDSVNNIKESATTELDKTSSSPSSLPEEQVTVISSDIEGTSSSNKLTKSSPGLSDVVTTVTDPKQQSSDTVLGDSLVVTDNDIPSQENGATTTTIEADNIQSVGPENEKLDSDGAEVTVHVPRPPSENRSSEGRRSRISGESPQSTLNENSQVTEGAGQATGGVKIQDEESAIGEAPEETVEAKTLSNEIIKTQPTAADDAGVEDANKIGGTESEESLSFVYVQDNSTTGSASVGKHEPEEDIMEILERRRRARMISDLKTANETTNINNNDNSLDEVEDDFEARAKEAEKAELDFIFIREEESDEEGSDQSEKLETKTVEKPQKAIKKPKVEKKVYVKALDITSIAPPVVEEDKVEEEEVIEEPTEDKPWEHPNQRFFSDGPLPVFEVPQESQALPSHLEEMLGRRSASKSAEELEAELLQMKDLMNKELEGTSMMVDEGEAGLTEEELKLAQELLEGRVKEVSSKIFNTGTDEPELEKLEVVPEKKGKLRKGKKGGKATKNKPKKPVVAEPIDRKKSIAEERDSIRIQRKLEKQRRLEEMKELQDKISQREALRQAQEDETRKRAEELAEEQDALEEEAAAIKRDEEEAREQLAQIQKNQRLERDARRKAEQQRKRQLAIDRREREKLMRDVARMKEQEMLERIGDAETRRELMEEEERRIEEEDRIADDQLEEELREQQIVLEEEEVRLRELEKEAEEEAMQRLIEERKEAERKHRLLQEEEDRIKIEEEQLRQALLIEEDRLREEKRLRELEEEAKLEEERKRLEQLRKLEEEARNQMRQELEYKREWAIKRREQNLNRRSHLDKIRLGQGFTRPWVYSYFVLWPRESFSKLMGKDPKSKSGFQRAKKSKAKDSNSEVRPDSPVPEFMPGLTTIPE